jgi:hypothetical protein
VALPPVPPVQTFLPEPPAPVASTPPPPVQPPECPPADALAAPDRAATLAVDEPPAPDSFVQQVVGSYTGTSADPASGQFGGKVRTTVKSLPSATTAVGQRVDSWRVERRGPQPAVRSVEVYQLVHPSTSPGATAAGIYLVGLAWSDPTRGALTFQPTGNGLQILPIPVQRANPSAPQYVGAATDPSTMTTLALTRNVVGRDRVDACGELVDAWRIEMTGTLTTPDWQRQVTWTQQVATAYGGVVVGELLSLTSVTGGYSWTRALRSTSVPEEPS